MSDNPQEDMDFKKMFGAGALPGHMNLDRLGKKPDKQSQIDSLQAALRGMHRNVNNLRIFVLGVAQAAGIKPEVLVRTLQDLDSSNEYLASITAEEKKVGEELNAKREAERNSITKEDEQSIKDNRAEGEEGK